jgi:hypothetical protein
VVWQRFAEAIGGLLGKISHATVRPGH